jgi:hypothetical protein
MTVYVGIDVHRKRSQIAVVDEAGQVLANRIGVLGVVSAENSSMGPELRRRGRHSRAVERTLKSN